MSILKESTELQDDETNNGSFQDDDKTISNRSSKASFMANSNLDEIANYEQNLTPDLKESRNNFDASRQSSVSSSSIASSLNIENQMNPLSIENGPAPYSSQKFTHFGKENDDDDVETADLMHLEPKLRDAWIKMRKLDKKLARISKKEKQVKLETMALIEKNRAELEVLKYTSIHKESAIEIANTARFLSLAYCDIDEEVEKEYPLDNEPSTPVFKTQLPDIDESQESSRTSIEGDSSENVSKKTSLKNESSSDKQKKFSAPTSHSATSSTKSTQKNQNSTTSSKKNVNKSKEQASQNGKDFIKRNIQVCD